MKVKLVNNRNDFFSQLPAEICLHIFSFISIKDLLSCSQVSKRWNKLSNDHLLWLNKFFSLKIKFPNAAELQEVSFDQAILKQYCLNHIKLLSNWQHGNQISPITVPVDCESMITGLVVFHNWVVSCSNDSTIIVLDLTSGNKLRCLRGSRGGVWSLAALTIDRGTYVAFSNSDCTVRLWDFLRDQCVHVFRGHENIVRCLTTAQLDNCDNGVRLISGSRDSTVRVWNPYTGDCEHLLAGHIGAVRSVRASSSRVVSGSYDHTVRVWDIKTGICLFILIGHTNRVFTLSLGKTFIFSASLDTTIRVWNIDTGVCAHVLEGHRSLTCEMAMNSDESLLVSGNADNSVRVWLISTGQCLMTLEGESKHSSSLTSVQIVLDRFIVSSGADGTVKLWNLSDGTFIRNILRLQHATRGGVIWRIVTSNNHLICAAGNLNRLDKTSLMLFNFSSREILCNY